MNKDELIGRVFINNSFSTLIFAITYTFISIFIPDLLSMYIDTNLKRITKLVLELFI